MSLHCTYVRTVICNWFASCLFMITISLCMVYSIKQYSHYHRSVASSETRARRLQLCGRFGTSNSTKSSWRWICIPWKRPTRDPPGAHQGPTRDPPGTHQGWSQNGCVDMSDMPDMSDMSGPIDQQKWKTENQLDEVTSTWMGSRSRKLPDSLLSMNGCQSQWGGSHLLVILFGFQAMCNACPILSCATLLGYKTRKLSEANPRFQGIFRRIPAAWADLGRLSHQSSHYPTVCVGVISLQWCHGLGTKRFPQWSIKSWDHEFVGNSMKKLLGHSLKTNLKTLDCSSSI